VGILPHSLECPTEGCTYYSEAQHAEVYGSTVEGWDDDDTLPIWWKKTVDEYES